VLRVRGGEVGCGSGGDELLVVYSSSVGELLVGCCSGGEGFMLIGGGGPHGCALV
jgi:hypothetical protein